MRSIHSVCFISFGFEESLYLFDFSMGGSINLGLVKSILYFVLQCLNQTRKRFFVLRNLFVLHLSLRLLFQDLKPGEEQVVVY